MRSRDGDQDKFVCLGSAHRRGSLIALPGKCSVEEVTNEVERDTLPLDLMRIVVRDYLAATISRSSTSNTNVAPGLMIGGRPPSP